MAEITYIIQFILSIILLTAGVFILLGPGWACIAAGAALYLSCASQSVSAMRGVTNVDTE